MSIKHRVIDRRTKTWWWTDNKTVDDLWINYMGVHAWAVYCILLRHADEKGKSSISASDISRFSGVSLRQVKYSLKQLVGWKLLKRVKKGGPVTATAYQILDIPNVKREVSHPPVEEKTTGDFWDDLDSGRIPPKGKDTGIVLKEPSRKKKLPKNWEPKPSHVELAKKEGIDLDREALLFREHAEATGRLMLNWDLCFNTWLRNARQFSKGHYGQAPKSSPNEAARNEVAAFYEQEELV